MNIVLSLTCGLLFPTTVFAEQITFKQTFNPKPSWSIALLLLMALLSTLIVLAKKRKLRQLDSSSCFIVEKKRLDAKTMIFIVEYQHELFLLADNQQALAWQLITKKS